MDLNVAIQWLNIKQFTCPEWGYPTEQNIQNYSSTPDISFWAIAFLKHLRSYIIGAPNNISKFIACKNEKEYLSDDVFYKSLQAKEKRNTTSTEDLADQYALIM